jgi:hypothetical protein
MGLRPIFEPNGWENGFTEGHFGGEISPIALFKMEKSKSGSPAQEYLLLRQ